MWCVLTHFIFVCCCFFRLTRWYLACGRLSSIHYYFFLQRTETIFLFVVHVLEPSAMHRFQMFQLCPISMCTEVCPMHFFLSKPCTVYLTRYPRVIIHRVCSSTLSLTDCLLPLCATSVEDPVLALMLFCSVLSTLVHQ